MDPALLTRLTSGNFWIDPEPSFLRIGAGLVPDLPELAGHVVFETSGSSGKPKGVALSKTALLASAAAVNRHLRVDGHSRWGLALPLHHVGGFGVAARAREAGCPLIDLLGKWDPSAFRMKSMSEGVTHTSLVPTQVHDLVKERLTSPPELVAIVVGGGRLDEATGQAARELGWPVLASYGMTEAGSQIATQGLELLDIPYKAAPIPLLPVWNARTAGDGALEISGEALFSGYLSDGRFAPRADEWHRTSDRVRIDGKNLTPLGRADLLVKVLGELVNPESIESELLEISAGRLEAGTFVVAAIPDERAEHLLVPVFEAGPPDDILLDILDSYTRGAPGYRRLAPMVVVGKLPRSGLGKPLRAEIARLCRESPAS